MQLLRGMGQEVYSIEVLKLPARPSRPCVLEVRLVSVNAEGCGGSELLVVWWYAGKEKS